MEFNPNNSIVKLCLQGMQLEENGKPDEAAQKFHQAWNEATQDFEKFLAAYYIARRQEHDSDRLQWLQTALDYALKINDASIQTAIPSLHANIARCYEAAGDHKNAAKHQDLANSFTGNQIDSGPFYHGTRADLQEGDMLTPGRTSNYEPGLIMNHIYFTAMVNGAGLAAALAKGEGPERVYVVEATGPFENDPNVTDKKFPGNPTRSYRTLSPLKVIGEVTDWQRVTPEELQKWRERLANSTGEIIN